jgi:hypothetical protein
MRSYIRMGISPGMAYAWSRSRIACPAQAGGGWPQACSPMMKTTVTVQRLKQRGYIEFAQYFQRFDNSQQLKPKLSGTNEVK